MDEILHQRPPRDLEGRLNEVTALAVELRGLVEKGDAVEAVIERLEQSPLPAALVEARNKTLG